MKTSRRRTASRVVGLLVMLAAAFPLGVGAILGAVGCGDKSSILSPDGGNVGTSARTPTDGGNPGSLDASLATDASAIVDDLALPLPMTEDLATRMRHLLEAVAQKNPDLGNDALFPRDAFVATRDAADPPKAWETTLSNMFRRAVERSHKRTKGIEDAKFVGFELGHAVTQGAPKKHGWKRPLWQVKHSKLTFTIEGKERHLEIAEMTAWRGAWYVTRLR